MVVVVVGETRLLASVMPVVLPPHAGDNDDECLRRLCIGDPPTRTGLELKVVLVVNAAAADADAASDD